MIARSTSEDLSGSLVVPKWFLYIASAIGVFFNIIFIPWAVWVTALLFSIDSRTGGLGTLTAKIETISERISVVEGSIRTIRELDDYRRSSQGTEIPVPR